MASFNHFSAIANLIEPFCAEVTAATAQDIIDAYEATAPRDTGRMAESGYVVTSKTSTYDQLVAPETPMTKEGNPYKDPPYLLPEVEAPDNDTDAKAAIAMNYAVYPELGTVHQSPQPAFFPAVMQASDTFENRLGGFEDYLEANM